MQHIGKSFSCFLYASHFLWQKFKQKGREEQCEPDDPARAKKVAELVGVDPTAIMKGFCKPKIKVGKI